MSAAAARRRKQQKKNAAATSGGVDNDPVQLRLDSLLVDPTLTDEAVAYEALQLAQSAVRRNVKLGHFARATDVAYSTSLALLVKSGRVSVSSQLLAVLVQVLSETHTECTEEWVGRFAALDSAYRTALDKDEATRSDERGRLQRLHLQFLKKGLKWSNDLGRTQFGAMGMHALLGDHCWNMSNDEAVVGTEAQRKEAADKMSSQDSEDTEDELEEEAGEIGLRNEAVSHYALAERITTILDKLKSLPAPTAAEQTMGHFCLPSQRDALLTRTILVLLAVENLRDAGSLASAFLKEVETTRTPDELKQSYLDKTDGKAPSHIMFVCMLIRICEKDVKTAPLFNWLVRNFGAEMGTMYDPEKLKTYTTKIGRVYFDIQPPPNMMDTLENMMGMMGGMGGGGMGGAPGGMNPMMAAMQAMQQGAGA